MVARLRQTGLLWAAAVAALLSGCSTSGGRPDDQLGGLVVAEDHEEPPIDVSKVNSDRAELLRAANMPHRRVGALLGGHVFHGNSTIEVKEGDKVVQHIEETTRIEYRADGQFHARLDNDHDYGREAVFAGGTLYVRPRHSKYNKRAPTSDDEPLELRDELFGNLGAQLDLVGFAAELSGGAGAQVGGRQAREIDLALDPHPGKPSKQTLPRRKWRESIHVTALKGKLFVDAESGAPLKGELDAALTFTRDGHDFTMTLHVTHAIESVGTDPEVKAPPDDMVVVVAQAYKEADERAKLLHGIAPPARKAPVPSDTAPAESSGGGHAK